MKGLCALLVVALAASAHARPKHPTGKPVDARVPVAVLAVPGAQGAAARKALIAAISGHPGLLVVDPAQVDGALQPMGGHVSGPEDAKLLADALRAGSIVEGTVLKSPRGISVRVLSGRTGAVIDKLVLKVKDAKFKVVDAAGSGKLRASIARAGPLPELPGAPASAVETSPEQPSTPVTPSTPVAAEPTHEPTPAPRKGTSDAPHREASAAPERVREARPTPSREESAVTETKVVEAEHAGAGAAPLVDVEVGGGFMRRTLNYTDDIFQALNAYRLVAGPSVGADLEAYPLVLAHAGAAANLGVTARYDKEPGLSSVDAAGDKLSTVSDDWEVGLKFRWPFSFGELSGTAGYARQRFSFVIPPNALSAPAIPGVTYASVRIGAGARIPVVERVWVLLGAAYLDVLSSGQISSAQYFPRLGVGAVEGRAGVAVRISGPFEARGWADYRRYFFAMNPKPGDPFVAGGAVDEYFTGTIAIAARW